jgi:hypothetical protein
VLAGIGALVASACGGSSSSSNSIAGPADNVASIVVNAGPAGADGAVNTPFTSVTICVPGSQSSCQTISGVVVDTGSSGLRILSSALTLSLPQQTDSQGNAVTECFQFEDGITWGPVQSADVKLAGEVASSVPIQIVGSTAYPTIPASCASTGLPTEDDLQSLGANGILGIGLFRQDCGVACAVGGSSNPGFYFSCSLSGCSEIVENQSAQLQNPVWMFPTDNNGVIVELPALVNGSAISLNGSLVFGIGTQSNNGLGSATLFYPNLDGNITTTFNGLSYDGFFDSGSNGNYFLDAATTGLPICSDASDFYCPSTTQNLSAVNHGATGTSNTVSFSVANADTLFNSTAWVLGDLAGPNAGSFDWGLPFFFGRNVFTAIESQNTPIGSGPYWAY